MSYSGRLQRGSLTNQNISPPATHMHQIPGARTTMERTTQTDYFVPRWKQFFYCLIGDDQYRKQRQREAAGNKNSIV